MFFALVVLLLVYMERETKRRDKAEKERFREFVLAIKSKDAAEYTNVLPTEGDLPVEEDDEMIDLDQVDPATLLRAIKNEGDKD